MKIGAGWIKESESIDEKTGNKTRYMSCKIDAMPMKANLGELQFALFPAEKKEGGSDYQPDYNIVWNPEKKKTE